MRIDLALISALARSGRIGVIRTLRQYPDRRFSINELAKYSRIPVMTCWRSVKELGRMNILEVEKIGNSHVAALKMTGELNRLLKQIPESDPHIHAAHIFSSRLEHLPGIMEARLFGKVARGEHSSESEVDLAILYDQNLISTEDASAHMGRIAQEVEKEIGIVISPHLIQVDHLKQGRGFAAELRDKEIIWKRRA